MRAALFRITFDTIFDVERHASARSAAAAPIDGHASHTTRLNALARAWGDYFISHDATCSRPHRSYCRARQSTTRPGAADGAARSVHSPFHRCPSLTPRNFAAAAATPASRHGHASLRRDSSVTTIVIDRIISILLPT